MNKHFLFLDLYCLWLIESEMLYTCLQTLHYINRAQIKSPRSFDIPKIQTCSLWSSKIGIVVCGIRLPTIWHQCQPKIILVKFGNILWNSIHNHLTYWCRESENHVKFWIEMCALLLSPFPCTTWYSVIVNMRPFKILYRVLRLKIKTHGNL